MILDIEIQTELFFLHDDLYRQHPGSHDARYWRFLSQCKREYGMCMPMARDAWHELEALK